MTFLLVQEFTKTFPCELEGVKWKLNFTDGGRGVAACNLWWLKLIAVISSIQIVMLT